MYHFPWGAVINSAVKRSVEQNLQLRLKRKLKGNRSATLCFAGTEFQSVFVGSENDKSFVRTYIRELPKHLFSFY